VGESFERHRPLLLKRARAYVRGRPDSVSAEDIAREMELLLRTLAEQGRLELDKLASPDRCVRALIAHAARRATRRGTLVKQISAGDDLRAVAADLAAIDGDLPNVPDADGERERYARERVDAVKGELAAKDRLFLALLLEDEERDADAAAALGLPLAEVEDARRRIARAAARQRLTVYDPTRGARSSTLPHEDVTQEHRLDVLAVIGGARSQEDGHVAEPVLSLMRHGDLDDDLEDALFHVASCAACRAQLTEGTCARRSLVVVAIEGPLSSQRAIAGAADSTGARLAVRGTGRWTAVIDAERADTLRDEIGKTHASRDMRLSIGQPVDVPLERSGSCPDLRSTAGTLSAEVAAWAEVPNAQASPLAQKARWTSAALAALVAALAIAYVFVSAR
jgi:hypothetical protein